MTSNYTPKHHKSGGYVYLIRMGDTPYHKIGIAITSPLHRLADLQVSSPFDLCLVESYLVGSPVLLEREIHKALAYCRVRGEWFKDTDGDVIKVFREYGSMALFDTALDTPTLTLRRAHPTALIANSPCPKCGIALDKPQWLAARRWGHCSNCKEA